MKTKGLLAVTLLLSLFGSAAAFALSILCGGLGASGMGCTNGNALELAAKLFGGVFALTALLAMAPAAKTAFERIASAVRTRQPSKPSPPKYAWACYVCQTANAAGESDCSTCGNPASIASAELATARTKFASGMGDTTASSINPHDASEASQ